MVLPTWLATCAQNLHGIRAPVCLMPAVPPTPRTRTHAQSAFLVTETHGLVVFNHARFEDTLVGCVRAASVSLPRHRHVFRMTGLVRPHRNSHYLYSPELCQK